MKPNVSFIIPAYNEEKNLYSAVDSLLSQIKTAVKSYEILIIDDGSTDATGKVAKEMADKNKNVKVIHHPVNLGFGQSIRDGIRNARKEYVIGFPGDNDTSAVSIRKLLERTGDADLIISYTENSHSRSFLRRFFSSIFVILMNAVMKMNLRYYNGSFLCKTKTVQRLRLISPGFTIYAEAKVHLIKNGATFIEVPFEHIGRKYGKSKATNIKSIVQTLWVVMDLMRKYTFI